jgi:energy-coupling factor transporter ATP-binding protein EcfA2
MLEIMEGLGDRTIDRISGGQQQRVALARALALEPKVLLLDEPLSNLDANLRVVMRDEIRNIQERIGVTTIFVTHDQYEAMSISDRLLVLNDGVIQQIGSPIDIYEQPANEFIAGFVGYVNFLEGTVDAIDEGTNTSCITTEYGKLELDQTDRFDPFNLLYGTMAILIICNIIHFYTVSFLTATTAIRQLDKEFESVAESMAVPFYKTFLRVTVPVCFPAILEISVFYFVSSMATVSAVIFLYSSDNPLASVAVINMDDAGDTAPAAAMCMMIVFANVVVRSFAELVSRRFKRRTQGWRAR